MILTLHLGLMEAVLRVHSFFGGLVAQSTSGPVGSSDHVDAFVALADTVAAARVAFAVED